MARQRYRAGEWAGFIDEWNASGLKLPEFCRRRGLNAGTMEGWIYKPARKRAIETARRDGQVMRTSRPHVVTPSVSSPACSPICFAEVAVPASEPTGRATIEVVLATGRRLIVAPGFDPETLRRVVVVLEG